MGLVETSLGWLGDLVAQHLYIDDVPQPQRRRWSFDGDGWLISDDDVDEVARLKFALGDAQYVGPTAPSVLASGDGAAVAWSARLAIPTGATATVEIDDTIVLKMGTAGAAVDVQDNDTATVAFFTKNLITLKRAIAGDGGIVSFADSIKVVDPVIGFAFNAHGSLVTYNTETNPANGVTGIETVYTGQSCTGTTTTGGKTHIKGTVGTSYPGALQIDGGNVSGVLGNIWFNTDAIDHTAIAARGCFVCLNASTLPNTGDADSSGATIVAFDTSFMYLDLDDGSRVKLGVNGSITDLTDSTGGTGADALVDVEHAATPGHVDSAKCNDNFATLYDKVEELRAALLAAGLIDEP